jgi:hypothetical protein
LLRKYLEGVVDDGFGGQPDRAVGRLHSDRHRVLLAFLRVPDGDATDRDRALLREAAALDAHRTVRLQGVVRQLNRNAIDCLILKGAAFSHHYPALHLRPRNDDDLWVRERDFTAACAVLEAAGYQPHLEVTSSEITRQRHFVRRDQRGSHDLDLHWWPVNPSAFDQLPPFDECFGASVTLEGIGAELRAPGRVHGLLLACAHRVAHHTETEDAMWHCDIHFLASAFTPADWRAFELQARRAGVARVSGVALQYVTSTLGTRVPRDVVERLLLVAGEPSSRYLRALGPLRDFWLELRARDGARARLRLLTHHVLPPREYVRSRYGYNGVALLPFLYAHRAINGFAHWTAEFVSRLAR